MSTGGRFILYSDGIIEASNPREELFGSQHFLEVIDAYAPGTLGDATRGIMDAVRLWQDGTPNLDDVSLLAMEVIPSHESKE